MKLDVIGFKTKVRRYWPFVLGFPAVIGRCATVHAPVRRLRM